MKKHLSTLLVIVAASGPVVRAQVTLNYNAGVGLRDVVDSSGVPVPSGNEVRAGFFDAGFDVAANAGNLAALDAAWTLFDATQIRGIPPFGNPEPGRFADSASTSDTAFDGRRVTLWIFETTDHAAPAPDYGNVLEYGVFSSTAPNWLLPAQGTLPPGNTTTITSSEVDLLFYGDLVNGTPGSLQLAAAVPEPTALAVMTSFAIVALIALRPVTRCLCRHE